MRVFNESEWAKVSPRGHVTRDVSFTYSRNRAGFVVAKAVPNGPLVGRRTYVRNGRLQVEGMDFRVDESLV